MFDDKVVVISGGSSGLGLAIALILHKMGARLVLLARNGAKLKKARDGIEQANPKGAPVAVFECDVADKGSVDGAFKKIAEMLGAPDFLVNSAGVLKEGRFTDLSSETFRYVMDINYFGTLHTMQAVLPGMLERKSGAILNICSVAGRMGVYGYAAYCSSKHAITGLTDSVRSELCGTGVSLSIAYPPEFVSPMTEELETCRSPENRAMVQTIPVMSVEKVAGIIVKGLEKGQYEIIPGLPSKAVTRFNRWFPSLAFAVAQRRIRNL